MKTFWTVIYFLRKYLFYGVDCEYVEVKQEEICPVCKRRNK